MHTLKAVYAGSFDPVTNGHIDIIARAANLFGTLTVLIMKNDAKTPLFTPQERLAFLRRAVKDIPGVTVETADGLLADYARQHNVQILVRGLRGASDVLGFYSSAPSLQIAFPRRDSALARQIFVQACAPFVRHILQRGKRVAQTRRTKIDMYIKAVLVVGQNLYP